MSQFPTDEEVIAAEGSSEPIATETAEEGPQFDVSDAPPAPDEPEMAEAAMPAEGQAKLVVKRGGAETEDVFVFSAPATIGRFDPSVGPIDVDLASMPEGSYVSRKHARITLEEGVWYLEDLGSSNGTFILRSDFERIDKAELFDGTEVALGNARFIFKLS
ncbi:MAG: FHA domain-containing protein [Armatimonadetes bacterium]|nr:FHA domain-containing protein [Armatimonadota bacterium]